MVLAGLVISTSFFISFVIPDASYLLITYLFDIAFETMNNFLFLTFPNSRWASHSNVIVLYFLVVCLPPLAYVVSKFWRENVISQLSFQLFKRNLRTIRNTSAISLTLGVIGLILQDPFYLGYEMIVDVCLLIIFYITFFYSGTFLICLTVTLLNNPSSKRTFLLGLIIGGAILLPIFSLLYELIDTSLIMMILVIYILSMAYFGWKLNKTISEETSLPVKE
jgi:hypothetical protein